MLTSPISTLEQALVGHPCRVRAGEYVWFFDFDPTTLNVEAPWRIVTAKGIVLGSEDHRQKFGLPEPIDAEAEANKLVNGLIVTSAEVDELTADLRITFDRHVRLDVFNTSAAYEAWNADVPDRDHRQVTLIGMGGGRVVMARAPKR